MRRVYKKESNISKNTLFWIKSYFHRWSILGLLLVAIILFSMDSAGKSVVVDMRTKILDRLIGVANFLTTPILYVNNVINFFHQYSDLVQENKDLQKQNTLANKNILLVRILRAENIKLRNLLNFTSSYSDMEYITTHVVGSHNNLSSSSAFIPLGSEDGINNNQAVVSDKGLVGKTVDVGKHSARILFLTDKNFRIPVITTETSTRAIMSGCNDGCLKLLHLPYQFQLNEGEYVMTAGDNEFFPPGIYIGFMSQNNRVVTSVNLKQINFVSIIKSKNMQRLN